MKKVNLVYLIVIGIVTSNFNITNCCQNLRSDKRQKVITTLSDKEKRSTVLLLYDNGKIPDRDSQEADHANKFPDRMKGITLNTSRKIKRNSPVFENVLSHYDDDLKNTSIKTAPRTLLATISNNNDDNTDSLSNNQKIKRNPSDKEPSAMQKLRRARDKKFMCLCEETKCRNKDCLRDQAQTNNRQFLQEYNEDSENISAEVIDETNDMIQKNGPKKFNIPFANNVNIDQRVIVGDKSVKLKPPLNTFYPVYANPQIYHYTPYTLAHPGLIYTGVTPLQQNYAPAAAYNQLPSPSPIPANLLKLWKNGAQNLLPTDNNSNNVPAHIPNFSSENVNNESPGEPSKVTTPRQVDNRLYAQNYPSQDASNIKNLRPAYSYSTDFPYNQHYNTEIINTDDFKFIAATPTEQLRFGDPITTNYAPNYYPPKQITNTKYGSPINNQYSSNYQPPSQNQYPNKNIPAPVDKYSNNVPDSNAAFPNNNQNVPLYDHNGLPVPDLPSSAYFDSPGIENNGYQPYQDLYNPANGEDLSIEVDKMTNDYRNNVPEIADVPSDSDLRAYDNPPPNKVALEPFKSYNQPRDFSMQWPASYNVKNIDPSVKPQSNIELYNNAAQPAITLEDVNNGYASHHNPQRTSTLRNTNGYNTKVATPNASTDQMENLFRGLEQILLNNVSVSDTPQTQAVDERPLTTYENPYQNPDNVLVQNAVKKVLNNFVPGKSEDLLANYNTEKSRELVTNKMESLSPDIANTQVLKNLLNVPEVENMIVETTSNLINQVVGSPVPNKMIKDTLRKVVNDIPRPTSPPKNKSRIRIRLAKRLPRYDESSSRAVFQKIKSIIDKSELGEEAATHPLAQNLIVKTVKYSLDKEKGVVDEAAIRRAFNQLIKSRRPTDSYKNGSNVANSRPLIIQPKETMNNYDKGSTQDPTYTTEDAGYKLAPAVPVTERRLQGGVWVESSKNLVGNQAQGRSALEEKKRKELERQLDMLKQYDTSNSTENVNDENTENVGSSYYTTMSQNTGRKSDVSTRQALSRYYDGMEITENPQRTPIYLQANNYPINPVITTINYENYQDPSYIPQQTNSNQVNLLVDSTDKHQSGENYSPQEPTYMGKLVPVNSIKGNSENSNLVWIGDGVKLPLTMRKMPDGSYALTLSDELCQMFAYKKCPCCLPDVRQGIIVRERRNGEYDFTDDVGQRFSNKISGNYRVRRESGEVTTSTSNVQSFKTFSNAIGRHDFNDDDYVESEENNNSIRKGAPYKYQRYANEDKLISGRTRALGNMLQWMKDVVTEAHEKRNRQRYSNSNALKHKVLLF